jgi:hypothetical protein
MSANDEMLIVLRAAKSMRGVQQARDDLLERGDRHSPAYQRLCAAARQVEAQFDLALEALQAEITRGDPANDD